MLDGKKLAQMFRTDYRIIIRRLESGYLISNTYVLVRVSEKTGLNFVDKWNGYKTTVDIPPLDGGETYEISSHKQRIISNDPLKRLIRHIDQDELMEVTITDLCKSTKDEVQRIYGFDHGLGVYQNKYHFLIDEYKPASIKTEGMLKPLILFNEAEDVMAMIMPVNINYEIENELTRIAG